MTDLALHPRTMPRLPFWLLWAVLALVAVVLWVEPGIAAWAVKYPRGMVVPISTWIGEVVKWLVDNVRFLTRGLAAVIDIPLQVAFAVLAKGFTIGGVTIPRLAWVGVAGAAAIAGHAFGGMRLAVISALCFLYIALFGQWDSAMLTLALVIMCVPFGVALGLLFGILAYRSKKLDDWFIRPSLDLAQTMPAFAYLVPILLLFGSGPVPGLIATAIFASPPMVRATKLALEQVPEDIQSFADMSGCTRRQKLWRVMLPTARPMLMIGVNQVIMMTLNMVIISSMIGAGGLGYDVLLALRALKIGVGLEAGLAIVALAVALDRISAAAASRRVRPAPPPGAKFAERHPHFTIAIAWLILTTLLSLGVPVTRPVAAGIDGALMTIGAVVVVFFADSFVGPFQGFLVTMGVPIAAWCGIFLGDLTLRRRAYADADLQTPRGRYGAVRWDSVVLMVVGTVLGWGLVTNTFAGWLSWQGFLLGPFGGKTGTWAYAGLGVLVAIVVGYVGTLVLSRGAVARQEGLPQDVSATRG